MIELTIKNCNENIITYNFNKMVDFVFKMDTIGFENEIPMLDDEIINVKINHLEVENSNLKIVNDLYEMIWKTLLKNKAK